MSMYSYARRGAAATTSHSHSWLNGRMGGWTPLLTKERALGCCVIDATITESSLPPGLGCAVGRIPGRVDGRVPGRVDSGMGRL
jgi:hypothetical protein